MTGKPQHGIKLEQEVVVQVGIVILDDAEPQRIAALKLVDHSYSKASALKALVKIASDVAATADKQNLKCVGLHEGDFVCQVFFPRNAGSISYGGCGKFILNEFSGNKSSPCEICNDLIEKVLSF